jgi:hypothetical protein
MLPELLQSEIHDLRERVRRLEESAGRTRRGRTNMLGAARYLGKSREWLRRLLEESAGRTRRGRTNMLGAARYLGKSREWLRRLHLRGEGPRRAPDGTYSYDDLDAFSLGRGPPAAA